MVREVFFLKGKRRKCLSIEDAHKLVMQKYPQASRNGCVAAWGWYIGEEVVAEAWMRKKYWHFVIKE